MPSYLLLDLLRVLLPVGMAIGLLLLGKRAHGLSRSWYIASVVLAFLVITADGAIVFVDSLSGGLTYLRWINGAFTLVCLPMCFLIGVVWGLPKRTLSRGFLFLIVGLGCGGIVFNGGGRLIWRFAGDEMWQRSVDRNGCLAQSWGMTCSPCAAVMLLDRHGIRAGEGEMAYRANTSLLGTSNYDIAAALQERVAERGWSARTRKADHDFCVKLGVPFMVSVDMPRIGAHALFVERITAEKIDLIDPLGGERKMFSREEFANVWDGDIVWIETVK